MPQFIISPDHITAGHFIIEGSEAHHLIRVLRKKNGDLIQLTDGHGSLYEGIIEDVSADKTSARGRINRTWKTNSKRCRITLFQGLPRGAKFDYVIEKAVELGADVLIPYLSIKNPVKSSDSPIQKLERWEKLVASSTRQCGRADLMHVHGPVSFEDLKSMVQKSPLTFLFSTDPSAQNFKERLRSKDHPAEVAVVVGPESGLSPDEEAVLKMAGALPVRLGQRILRTETAGLAGLSILNYEWDLD